jgi:small subunit ribosomal protein S6
LAQNVYECMFILDSNRYARDPGGVSGTIPQMVEKLDGEILANRLWNEQKLAYPINGQRKGTYWLTYFRMDSQKLVAFNRACQLNEHILRHLTLKVEPRLVEALVAHASGQRQARPEEKKEERKPDELEAVGVAVGDDDLPGDIEGDES